MWLHKTEMCRSYVCNQRTDLAPSFGSVLMASAREIQLDESNSFGELMKRKRFDSVNDARCSKRVKS